MFSVVVYSPIACTLSLPSPHHCIPLRGPSHRKLVIEADSGEEQWIQWRERRPDLYQVHKLLITIPKTKIKQDDTLERFEELFRSGNQGKLRVFNVDLNHETAGLLKEVRKKLSRREEYSSKTDSGTKLGAFK